MDCDQCPSTINKTAWFKYCAIYCVCGILGNQHDLFHHPRAAKRKEFLLNLARDNTQLLINHIWEVDIPATIQHNQFSD